MKVVLFSVLMLIAAVQAGPKHGTLSCTSAETESKRRVLLKRENHFEGLHIGDPLRKTRRHNAFRELLSQRRGGYLHHVASRNGRSGFHFRESKEPPALYFRSPEKLKEFLFSEAGNAQHILKNEAAVYGPDTRSEAFSKHGSNTSRDRINYRLRMRGPRRHRPRLLNDEARERIFVSDNGRRRHIRRKPPGFLRPYRVPYFPRLGITPLSGYPPPWYDPRPALFIPPYPMETQTTPKPSPLPILGNDLNKLKKIVDELDSLSEDDSDEKSDKHEKDQKETIADMKHKIDKVIIPMLNKISKELATSTPKEDESEEEDTKKEESSDGESKKSKGERKEKKKEGKDGESKKSKEDKKEKKKEKDSGEGSKKCKEDDEPHLKHNFPCRIDGVWVCALDALHLNISSEPNMTLKVTVISDNPKKSKYINKDWLINGFTLANTGGPFFLAAVCPEKKKVANFIGQCRSCKDEDLITGLWTFSTAGKDCADMITSFETKIDVFKRIKGYRRKSKKKRRHRKSRKKDESSSEDDDHEDVEDE